MQTAKEQLMQIKELLDLGLITQDDFDKKKAKILADFTSERPQIQANVSIPETNPVQPSTIDITLPADKKDLPLTSYPQGHYEFHCKDATKFESIMNLGMTSGKYAMDYFKYHNGEITIRMKDGRTIQGMLNEMTAKFDTYKQDTQCKIISGKETVSIYSIWRALPVNEWWTLFNILTHCGSVKGLDNYLYFHELYNTNGGKAARGVMTAMKIISKI